MVHTTRERSTADNAGIHRRAATRADFSIGHMDGRLQFRRLADADITVSYTAVIIRHLHCVVTSL